MDSHIQVKAFNSLRITIKELIVQNFCPEIYLILNISYYELRFLYLFQCLTN